MNRSKVQAFVKAQIAKIWIGLVVDLAVLASMLYVLISHSSQVLPRWMLITFLTISGAFATLVLAIALNPGLWIKDKLVNDPKLQARALDIAALSEATGKAAKQRANASL